MKTAMIWGASGGIGRALTEELSGRDYDVLAISRNIDGLSTETSRVIEADPTEKFAVRKAVQAASMEVEAIDFWIYAAGDIASSKVKDLAPNDWRRILDANLTGPYQTLHYSAPLLADDAHVVFLGAVTDRIQLPGLAAYAAAKSGLEAFANTLKKEQRRWRVSVVRPAAVATGLWDKVPLKAPRDALAPRDVARRIVDAHEAGHDGPLELP